MSKWKNGARWGPFALGAIQIIRLFGASLELIRQGSLCPTSEYPVKRF
jgi:hypothetical protein